MNDRMTTGMWVTIVLCILVWALFVFVDTRLPKVQGAIVQDGKPQTFSETWKELWK